MTPPHLSKFNNFLWVCWFLGKNLSNSVPPAWKLNNPYYHTLHACFDMWFRTKCFSMKKDRLCEKNSSIFFLFVCRVGTPLHHVHRRTKKFPFQLQPRRRGAKGGLHVLLFSSVGCWITWFISSWERNNSLQSWSNSQKDKHFTQNDNFPGLFWVVIL